MPPPRGVPSTQKSPALSQLFRPREPAPSRLRVAQKVCSLLICQEAVVAEAHRADFDFPALPCLQCPRVNASGVCETGESVCETQGSQRCFLRKVYEDDTLSYGYQGCSSVCFPLMLFNPAVTLEERCCNDSPFCNKF
ncbi:secreted protein of Ly-6 domain 1-like [Acinonyx jubatus]|uniref:Secreted protein of Ly-6 domain 1-like n=1 Tax=Acinonyx jubatus TaxID=32536 RepID=A0ABM3NGQ7_ACIJB|nr:secreted protein of Ly-6 domain 1-like [Acinonyx jubatus]